MRNCLVAVDALHLVRLLGAGTLSVEKVRAVAKSMWKLEIVVVVFRIVVVAMSEMEIAVVAAWQIDVFNPRVIIHYMNRN